MKKFQSSLVTLAKLQINSTSNPICRTIWKMKDKPVKYLSDLDENKISFITTLPIRICNSSLSNQAEIGQLLLRLSNQIDTKNIINAIYKNELQLNNNTYRMNLMKSIKSHKNQLTLIDYLTTITPFALKQNLIIKIGMSICCTSFKENGQTKVLNLGALLLSKIIVNQPETIDISIIKSDTFDNVDHSKSVEIIKQILSNKGIGDTISNKHKTLSKLVCINKEIIIQDKSLSISKHQLLNTYLKRKTTMGTHISNTYAPRKWM